MVSMPNLDLLIDNTKSVVDFAIKGWDQAYIDRYGASLKNAAKHYGFPLDIHAPISEYGEIAMTLLLYGVLSKQFARHFPKISPPKTVPDGRFEGVVTNLMRRYGEKSSYSAKQRLEKLLIQQECPDCGGVRFCSEVLAVTVFGVNIIEALAMSLEELSAWVEKISAKLSLREKEIIGQVLSDLLSRIGRIISAGAGKLQVSMHFLPDVEVICPACRGKRYQKAVLGVKYKGYSISDILDLSIDEAVDFLADEKSIVETLHILQEVGLGYLSLGQSTTTLSGGEKVLYLFDEPTIGLHPQDVDRLIGVFDRLVQKGNSVAVIEHNRSVLLAADWMIDLGIEGGKKGGNLVACGTQEDIISNPTSSTGKILCK